MRSTGLEAHELGIGDFAEDVEGVLFEFEDDDGGADEQQEYLMLKHYKKIMEKNYLRPNLVGFIGLDNFPLADEDPVFRDEREEDEKELRKAGRRGEVIVDEDDVP